MSPGLASFESRLVSFESNQSSGFEIPLCIDNGCLFVLHVNLHGTSLALHGEQEFH